MELCLGETILTSFHVRGVTFFRGFIYGFLRFNVDFLKHEFISLRMLIDIDIRLIFMAYSDPKTKNYNCERLQNLCNRAQCCVQLYLKSLRIYLPKLLSGSSVVVSVQIVYIICFSLQRTINTMFEELCFYSYQSYNSSPSIQFSKQSYPARGGLGTALLPGAFGRERARYNQYSAPVKIMSILFHFVIKRLPYNS